MVAADSNLAYAILISVGSSTGLWASLQSGMRFLERRRERKEKADREESRRWYQESRENYATAKAEASEAKKEAAGALAACDKCVEELADTRRTMFKLLEDFEEQVISMLMVPGVDPKEIRMAARAVVEAARAGLRRAHRD